MPKQIWPWIVSAIALQASAILYMENAMLRRQNALCHDAGEILRDEVEELNATVTRMVYEKDSQSVKSYVLGAVQAISDPKKFGDVWHDGYNRGLGQSTYVSDNGHKKE